MNIYGKSTDFLMFSVSKIRLFLFERSDDTKCSVGLQTCDLLSPQQGRLEGSLLIKHRNVPTTLRSHKNGQIHIFTLFVFFKSIVSRRNYNN